MRFRIPENFEKIIIAFLLAALVVLMLAAAACRHLWPEFHRHPLNAAAACLAWMACVGMARAAYLGTHVKVAVLEGLVGVRSRVRLRILADAMFFLFALLAFGVGVAVVVDALRHPSPSSHPFICASVPFGAALTMLRLTERLRDHIREWTHGA